MKNALIILALVVGCSSESTPEEAETIADWSLEDGNLTFRTPDIYGDDDWPKPEPSICGLAPSLGEVWIAEITSASDVIFPEVKCDGTATGPQTPHQAFQLKLSTGESAVALADARWGSHDQAVAGQRVVITVVPAEAEQWVVASYLLMDGPGQTETTPGMPANFEELRRALESPDCPPLVGVTPKGMVDSIFNPSETICRPVSPAPDLNPTLNNGE